MHSFSWDCKIFYLSTVVETLQQQCADSIVRVLPGIICPMMPFQFVWPFHGQFSGEPFEIPFFTARFFMERISFASFQPFCLIGLH